MPQLQVKGTVARTAPAPNILDGAIWSDPVALRRRLDNGYTIAQGGELEHFINADSFRFFRHFLPSFKQNHKEIHLRISKECFNSSSSWALDEVTPFEKTRVLNPEPSKKILTRLYKNIAKFLPQLADVPIAETWAGMIEATPDTIPVLSEVSDLKGLFIATGLSGHGFGLGPGAGFAIADLATGRSTSTDLSSFRLSRFFDGSTLQLGPGI